MLLLIFLLAPPQTLAEKSVMPKVSDIPDLLLRIKSSDPATGRVGKVSDSHRVVFVSTQVPPDRGGLERFFQSISDDLETIEDVVLKIETPRVAARERVI